jgi:hypothetical protein
VYYKFHCKAKVNIHIPLLKITELREEKRTENMYLRGKYCIRLFQLFDPEPKLSVSGVMRCNRESSSL